MTQSDEAQEFVRSLDDDDLVAAAREEQMWKFVGKGSGHTAGRRFVVEEAQNELERRQKLRERANQQSRATARQTSSGRELLKLGAGVAAVLGAAALVGSNEESR